MSNVFIMGILTLLSFAGFGMYLRQRYQIATAVIPLFLFSSIVLLLFIAGLLNLLLESVYVIFLAGFFLFIYSIYQVFKKRISISTFFTPPVVFFSFCCIVFAILLKGEFLLHYDNFSHWGIIVKDMVETNSLPNDSSIITYKNYPPGSALFIYYFVTLIGWTESRTLISQAILIASTLTPLFMFSTWRNSASLIGPLFVAGIVLLIDSGSIYTLLVDSLLGYLTIAIVLIAYYYRDQWRFMTFINLPILSLLILVKDSGKVFYLFILIGMVVLLYRYYRRHSLQVVRDRVVIGYTLINIVVIPFFVNLLWSKYTESAYASGYGENKFAVTKETFTRNNKSLEFAGDLLQDLLSASFNFSSSSFQAMFLVNVVAVLAIVLIAFLYRRFAKTLALTVLFVNISYAAYILFLYMLYLFLMPEVEAVYLAGFDRYHATMTIFYIGTLLVFIIHEVVNVQEAFHKGRAWIPKFVVFLACLIVMAPLLGEARSFFEHVKFAANPRMDVIELYSQLKGEEDYFNTTPITLIYDIGESDRGLLRHIMRYERMNEMTSINTACKSEEDLEELIEDLNQSSYLIVLKVTSDMEKCLADYNSIDDLERGIYRIEDGVISSKVN
ncbi:hypothetical protein [Bacillus solitudinis]|uniref:hypothetical protein n=1 Tax=Bacillus solitudinis TaxID=2014074 RepID=UPI000C2371EE|nr:hypothetical protein [Bacillus solitudinis]